MADLKVTTPSDREIQITRVFGAPRRLVFDAFTKPDLLKRWLGVMDDWSLPVCEVDLRVGGRIRYVWRSGKNEMGMSGVFREVTPPARVVHTEVFDEAWYPGEAMVTTEFIDQGLQTTVKMKLLYESREARDGVLKSGMETGIAKSYDKLDEVLAS